MKLFKLETVEAVIVETFAISAKLFTNKLYIYTWLNKQHIG